MDSSQLRVFVSSKMQELAPERLAIKSALEELKVDGWVFEEDAGARPQTIQQTYKEEVEKADLYIGLFWRGYGDHTIEEYEQARRLGKDCLIYEKRADVVGQRDARLEGFLKELGDVESGLTPKWFHTPEELRELVKRDVARWQAGIVRRFKVSGAPLAYQSPTPPETKTQKELGILLNKVEQFWVKGVLENSVHHQVLIELGKKKMVEAVEHPWETVLELPLEAKVSIPSGGRITDVFADVGRYLLILGAPGSGKTTTMLELARNLIIQSRNDPGQPVPTVFNLSSWADQGESIADWMVKELKAKYHIPIQTGRAWLEERQILPLLDGLDEVSPDLQGACVGAINEFVQGYLSGLVVCSRLQEYTNLSVRLKLNGAVCLQPLSIEQADEYLLRAGPELAALRGALEEDENLQELMKTPLMLSIMSLAYEGQPLGALAGGGLDTVESLRRHVFDTYIERMFQRKGRPNLPFTKERLTFWLCWLARRMQSQSQSIFLVEQLQPAWLSTTFQWVVYLFISRLLAGLLWGVAVGFPVAVIAYENDEPFEWALYCWAVSCLCGLGLGLLTWLINCIRTMLGMKLRIIAEASGTRYSLFDLGLYVTPWIPFTLLVVWSDDGSLNLKGLALVGLGVLAGMIHWFIFESRRQRRDLDNDILTVETLSWSWPAAFKSGAWWTATAFIILLIVTFATSYERVEYMKKYALQNRYMEAERELLLVEHLIPDVPKEDGERLEVLEARRRELLLEVERYGVESSQEINPSFWEVMDEEAGTVLGGSLIFSSIAGLIGLLLGGFKRGVTQRKTSPNQGVILSIRNAILGGVTAGLITALLGGALTVYLNYQGDGRFKEPLRYGFEVALTVGVIIGLTSAFRNGGYDALKHYVLRFLLYYKGYIPKNYMKVLNYAATLIILQKVGGGYIFIHRLLLEHFATIESAGSEGAASNLIRRTAQ
jgi:hypothetical protein